MVGQKFNFLTISSLYVPYILATAKNRGLQAAYVAFWSFSRPVDNTPRDKLGVWRDMRLADALVLLFWWSADIMFRWSLFIHLFFLESEISEMLYCIFVKSLQDGHIMV